MNEGIEAAAGFVHLRVRTEYSFPEGLCRLEELMKKAKSWGMTSLAITDIQRVNGAVRFYESAERYGIKPIIGCEVNATETGGKMILLAVANRGFERIIEWLNRSSNTITDGKWDTGDVIALSGGSRGPVHRLLAEGRMDEAEKLALEYARLFGNDHFYLEVQRHGAAGEDAIIKRTVRISQHTGIPLAATHDVQYLNPEDGRMNDMLLSRHGLNRSSAESDSHYFLSPQEMINKFRDLPEALNNTVQIAERVQFALKPGKYQLPKFPSPTGENEEEQLRRLCRKGLENRYRIHELEEPEQQELLDRMNRELDVIVGHGLCSYFLIVWDIVQFAKSESIPVGPGRGSAAGSLVVYLLGITEVDPVAYGLSFERFLSPDRPDLPDIDLDVCQRRRQSIFDYIKEKYGPGRAAHIGVINTLGSRGAVREAGKTLSLPDRNIDVLAKLLPAFSGSGGIRHCIETLPELRMIPLDKEPFKSLFELAEFLEGISRHHSAHPSGILIGNEELHRTVPLQRRPNGDWMTLFNKDDVQAIGMLKIDLLGLRNLTVISDTLETIRELTGRHIEIRDIPANDLKTFQTIQKGETLGCFQLESMGIRRLMRRMKPADLDRLCDLLALYRPGAWQANIVETYLRRLHGEESSRTILPEMEPVLSKTYGLILYQEQVMQIAHIVAGYTMGEADLLRRALSRNLPEAIAYHRELFIRGAEKKGLSAERASIAFDFLVRFSGYSFNKAHSISYAHISYWTVYLKTHYPKEYMSALLASEGGYFDKRVYLREIARLGIPLLHPDVNRSGFGYQAEPEGIRVGLDAVKGAGRESVAALLNCRREGGVFSSVNDFLARVKLYPIKSPVIQAWMNAGACDNLGYHRPTGEIRKLEKALLGFTMEQGPSEKWQAFLREYKIVPIAELRKVHPHKRVRICGSIVHFRRYPAAGGGYMLQLVLQDHTEMVEVILSPQTYKSNLYQLNPQGIIVQGILRGDRMNVEVVAERITSLGG